KGARRPIFARLVGAVLDCLRTRPDQAAPLRAAALSGDCYTDRWRAGAAIVVAILADERNGLVVRDPRVGVNHSRGGRDRADAAAGFSGMAVARSGNDLRAVRVVAL